MSLLHSFVFWGGGEKRAVGRGRGMKPAEPVSPQPTMRVLLEEVDKEHTLRFSNIHLLAGEEKE
jgi:hypothetical protein